MIVSAARSRTELATMPPVALSFSHREVSISKPITGTLASIRRSDRAVPIRPRPMIPTGAFTCMISSPSRFSLGFDAGGLGFRGPPHDFAADEGAEFVGTHRGDDHADAGELFPCCRHGEKFFALGIELVDDRGGRARRRQ